MIRKIESSALQVYLILVLHLLGCVNSEEALEESTDTRIGINLNQGHSFAMGPGGASLSNTGAYNADIGIAFPGGNYQRLHGASTAYGNSLSTGPNAPLTYSNSNAGPFGGSGSSGFDRGIGNAASHSATFNQQIALGNGAVLYNNLKNPT